MTRTVKCLRFWQGLSVLPHRRPTPEEAVAFLIIATPGRLIDLGDRGEAGG